jgi:hypothetical protein
MGRSLVTAVVAFAFSVSAYSATPCTSAALSGLPLPSSYAKDNDPGAYETIVGNFLKSYKYVSLGWCEDKAVRDTGPFIAGNYYGTHPAVRVWYSPEVGKWIEGGRKGELPDGAMIIKEQFKAPASQYNGWTDEQLRTYFSGVKIYDWTFMIRDRKGAADGWYWGEIFNTPLDSYQQPFSVFNTGFGLYCTRCHASAESEHTFSAENNLKGHPGNYLTFVDDNSWFWNGGGVQPPPTPAADARRELSPFGKLDLASARLKDLVAEAHPHSLPNAMQAEASAPHPLVSVDWSRFYAGTNVTPKPNPLPGENYDHVVSPPVTPQHFVTSDQCFGCHAGAKSPGNPMLVTDDRVPDKPLVNIGPYGEWRWSPMGLAGRDPVFYAQLDSELAYLTSHKPDEKVAITNLCFSCHNAMGERQLEMRTNGQEPYTTEIPQITDLKDPRFEYGALGRDGISCAVCHHIKSTEHKSEMEFIEQDATGKFQLTAADGLEGPFKNPVTLPMKNTLGVQPVHDAYTQNGRICGTCHTIHLPVLDAISQPEKEAKAEACQQEKFSYEQATYLEWVNSSFQNVINDPTRYSGGVKTCQDCHMSDSLNGSVLQTKIANVEDNQYPAAERRAPNDQLNVPLRTSGVARHQFQGLNVYLLEMFSQFSADLGVRTCDYMASGCSANPTFGGIPFAERNFLEQAAEQTATLAVSKPALNGSTLTADVTVTNLTGHRFPSGVSFRRAFIDFVVRDATTNAILFESGRTNSIGAITDMKGNVLPSEYNGSTGPNGHAFQPHFWTGNPITNDSQVQIFEELLKDADGNFTTSFIRQDCHFKDNRILPLGWRKNGPDLKQFFGKPLEETWSDATGNDPHYQDPLGANGQAVVRYAVPLPSGISNVTVTAQLFYQAIPPYFLRQRFEQAPTGTGTQRLYYVTSTLDTTKTPFPGWKLLVAQATP